MLYQYCNGYPHMYSSWLVNYFNINWTIQQSGLMCMFYSTTRWSMCCLCWRKVLVYIMEVCCLFSKKPLKSSSQKDLLRLVLHILCFNVCDKFLFMTWNEGTYSMIIKKKQGGLIKKEEGRDCYNWTLGMWGHCLVE